MSDKDQDTKREVLFRQLIDWAQYTLENGATPAHIFEALSDLSYAIHEEYKKIADDLHADDIQENIDDEFPESLDDEDDEDDEVRIVWKDEEEYDQTEEVFKFELPRKNFWEMDSIDVIPLLKSIHESRTVEEFLSLAPFRGSK